jgi:hypothetical protein
MGRSRSTWKNKTTSGICISKLVVDHFVSKPGRDDEALHETWKAIKAKLATSLQITHPVYADKNLAEYDDAGVAFFRDCLGNALTTLEVIEDSDCTRKKACKSWDSVFNTSYFSDQLDKEDAASRSLLRPAVAAAAGITFPNKPVVPNKSTGFA